jgi:hypothetical protein
MPFASTEAVQIPMTRLAPSHLAFRLGMGCVYEPQIPDAYGILVMRHRPPRRLRATIHDQWSRFAPSHFLVTGRVTGDPLGDASAHGANLHLGWEAFAIAYRDELDALGESVRQLVRAQLMQLLRYHRRVVLLSSERALGGFELGARTQRRLFRDWILGRPLDLRDNFF